VLNDDRSFEGTLLIAALLLLALAFAGNWIIEYVKPGGRPWALLPWFGAAAGIFIVVALLAYLLSTRAKSRP
jgi:hypothetical protein